MADIVALDLLLISVHLIESRGKTVNLFINVMAFKLGQSLN